MCCFVSEYVVSNSWHSELCCLCAVESCVVQYSPPVAGGGRRAGYLEFTY